jgi:Ni,Fe-hydrogenase I small subunit
MFDVECFLSCEYQGYALAFEARVVWLCALSCVICHMSCLHGAYPFVLVIDGTF